MIQAKKINNVSVEPIVLPKVPKNIKGCDLFPDLSANIFLCAPKNSGKTTIIKKIIDECVSKDTTVIIFCGTVNNDPSWIEIQKSLVKRKIAFTTYDSIYKDKVNIVNLLIDEMKGDDEPMMGGQQGPLLRKPALMFGDGSTNKEEVVKKQKKKKNISPKFLIIFDDLSSELKDPAIPKLMKIHRHFSSKIIISSQSWIDTDSRIRKGNLDYVLLFKNISDLVLEQIHKELSIIMPFKLFLKMYLHATAERFHFLYIDRNMKYRKDFNVEYLISS